MLKVEMLSTGDEVLHGQSLTLTLPGWPIFSFIRGCHYLAAIRWGITLMT